jgi:hypothetical protein
VGGISKERKGGGIGKGKEGVGGIDMKKKGWEEFVRKGRGRRN